MAHARRSVEVAGDAGDAGSLRLRGMALNALGTFLEGTDEGRELRARAAAIAARLEHADLALRAGRAAR